VELTYVLPLRCGSERDGFPDGGHAELFTYVEQLCEITEVIVADGSPEHLFAAHRALLAPGVRHVRTDAGRSFLNGKVGGVTAGVGAASFERVIVADEDVRYRPDQLREIADRLRTADLVIPQNAFDPASVWHARWDTARILLNRAVGYDYPGTLALRRSTFRRIGGYSGDVLFENLELIRTVLAGGGTVRPALDVIVARRPPSTGAFLRQRVRQAYDDLAQPVRLAAHLGLLPAVVTLARRRSWWTLGGAAVAAIALAESGRRRDGGRDVYPPSASAFAPAWLAERAICVWLAVGSRAVLGGCRYRGVTIRRAATPMRELRRRAVRQGAGEGARASDAA
jgi:hypothetical protein